MKLVTVRRVIAIVLLYTITVTGSHAQFTPLTFPLGDGPWEFDTYEKRTRIRVSVVTKGLSHPWSMAWLPDGSMLITERGGNVRLLKEGVLLEEPLPGISGLKTDRLMDIALHPGFEDNGHVYFTYIKRGSHPDGSKKYWATTALARARFEGRSFDNIEEIYVADAWSDMFGGDGSRIIFAPDGKLFMASSHRRDIEGPQQLSQLVGKILRLNDDGSVPDDNPFLDNTKARPEIYSYGHRTILGFTFHPGTGELWQTENGPQGGDEVNIIFAGRNYGWPLVTYGRDYDGSRLSAQPWRESMQQPELFWVPSVTTSGMTFYTGDKIPAWKGNLFLGAMTEGRIPGTGHLQRIVFADNGGELRRESLLTELKQRIRDVRQGPDGLLYLLTEENEAALLVIEPVE